MTSAQSQPGVDAVPERESLWLRFGFWAGLSFFGLLLGGLVILMWGAILGRERDEEVLTVILASSLLLMLVAFTLVAMAFKRAGLADDTEALALPPGSVRALIAFVLLLIFAMMSIFLFERVDRESETIEGVTAGQFEQLDLATVISAEVTATTPAGEPAVYTVLLERASNPAQQDLAKQLTTALITLVTALTAFYFGARTSSTTTEALVRSALGIDADGRPIGQTDDVGDVDESDEALEGHPADDPDETGETESIVG